MPRSADPVVLAPAELLTLAALLLACHVMGLGTLAASAGVPLQPAVLLVTAALISTTIVAWCARQSVPRSDESRRDQLVAAVAALLVMCIVAGYVSWLAWPSLFPVTAGPDLVHHLSLIHFIQQRHVLPADPAFGAYLGEMTGYPPGSHILAAMTGEWLRRDAIEVLHPLTALAVALKAGLLFHIIWRLLPNVGARAPLASAGALLLFVPHSYVLTPVTHYGFYSQVLAETCAVAMFWAVIAWHQAPTRVWLIVQAIMGVSIVLTWPVFLPAPAIAAAACITIRHTDTRRQRATHLAIALGPVAIVVAAFAAARAGSAGILSSGGDVLTPAVALFGWPFLALTIAGAFAAVRSGRRMVPLAVFTTACLLQVASLIVLQHQLRATNYYLGFKTVHLLVYALVVLAALGLDAGWRWLLKGAPHVWRTSIAGATWVVPVIVVAGLLRSNLPSAPLPSPLTQPVYRAGRWARTHVPANCVDYLVPHWLTAYWLHIDVLGNARASARVTDATYDFRQTMGQWIGTGSMQYAVVEDWDLVPRDARDRMRVLEQNGTAAVVERTDGGGACSDRTPPIDQIGSARVTGR